MPTEHTVKLYTYDELDEDAQERAREWFSDPFDFDSEPALDTIENVLSLVGVEVATKPVRLYGGGTRQKPSFYWSVGGYRKYFSFEGTYTYKADALERIKAEWPTDERLHRIVTDIMEATTTDYAAYIKDEIAKLEAREWYEDEELTGLYQHLDDPDCVGFALCEHGTECQKVTPFESWDWEEADSDSTYCSALVEALNGLSHWAVSLLEQEHEHQTSEAYIADCIRANGYTFLEDGTRFDAE